MTEISFIMLASCLCLILATVVPPAYLGLKSTRNPRERVFIIQSASFAAIFAIILTGFIYFSIYALLFLGPDWPRAVWATFILGWVAYLPCLIWLIKRGNRKLQCIRAKEHGSPAE